MFAKNLYKMQQLSAPGKLLQVCTKKATKLMVKLLEHPKMSKMFGLSLKNLRL